ncbi:hypothetical protein ECG_04804 [Echinococcus granulosus]|uniref:Uncharacterized protein n=1 Tax=Echinococcus granulosus TaxID=6210 RepID=A0A068WGT1_ECHGR|nr:hypothetical protein ECG_04804 [Echinococcus granulosus]CDS16883.1 hypothetical protein EgrG_000959400 [Echinococcus granulosus]
MKRSLVDFIIAFDGLLLCPTFKSAIKKYKAKHGSLYCSENYRPLQDRKLECPQRWAWSRRFQFLPHTGRPTANRTHTSWHSISGKLLKSWLFQDAVFFLKKDLAKFSQFDLQNIL